MEEQDNSLREANVDAKPLIPQKTASYSATVLPDGRWLLYNTQANTAITLNAPAGIFWELCDGRTPLTDIITQLHELYPDISYSVLESETRSMMNVFIEQGLIAADAS